MKRTMKHKNPYLVQKNDWDCGPATVQIVLHLLGVSRSQIELAEMLGTTTDGTDPQSISRVLRKFGFQAHMEYPSSIEKVRALHDDGWIVILDYQAWKYEDGADYKDEWDYGHYSVLTGYNSQFIVLIDPSLPGAYSLIPVNDFLGRWHDYEIVEGNPKRYRNLIIAVCRRVQ